MDEEMKTGQEAASGISNTLKSVGSSISSAVKSMLQAFGRFLKTSFKLIGKFVKWLVSIIASNIYVLLIIVGVLIVLVIVMMVVMFVYSADFDKDKGTISSVGGVTGESFYGTRFMYYDNSYTAQDLANTYLEFTYNILKETNKTTTISIDFTAPYSSSSQINAVAVAFASALSKETGGTLLEHTQIIDHYGFTADEKDVVLTNISNYVTTNGLSSATSEVVLAALKTAYDTELGYMKNTCKKILIKDYILNGTDEFTSDIPKQNYFGFVYMPKQMVTLEQSSFIFVVDEEKEIKTKVVYSDGIGQTVLEEATADSTWFVSGMMEKALEVTDSKNYILNQFTAIDISNLTYLQDGKTLFQILRDGKFNTYFKNISVDDLNKTKTESTDGVEDILLKNINTGNCMYMQMEADSPFNLAEGFVTVKRY